MNHELDRSSRSREGQRAGGLAAVALWCLMAPAVGGAEADVRRDAAVIAMEKVMPSVVVLALGNPFGLGGSVSRGILSSKNRRPPAEHEPMDVTDWLQTDAAINPGSSGGPLINLRGEIIGISVAVYREGQGIGFAVPIKRGNDRRTLAVRLVPEKSVFNAALIRQKIGAAFQALTPQLAQKLHLPSQEGFVIAEIGTGQVEVAVR